MAIEELKEAKPLTGRYRVLTGPYRVFYYGVTAFTCILSFVQVFKIVIFGYVLPDVSYFAVMLGAFLPVVFLLFPATKKAPRDRVPWYDAVFSVASLIGPLYVIHHGLDIILGGWEITPPVAGKVLAGVTWILILEAVRRTGGSLLAGVILLVSLYPVFAYMCPGILMAKKYTLSRILGFHFLGTQSIFGLPTQVFGRLLMGYMIFAVALQSTGAANFFINLCLALLGNVRGGAAKVSILASAMFGTISGSAIANVVTTGSVTIPTMKRLGYPPYYAGAVEACASKGGVLTPPVMGVTAFIMADFIGVSYAEVCMAAALPILLYYTSLYAQTDFYAARMGLRGLSREDLPSIWKTLKGGWFHLFSIGLLIYLIFMEQVEALAPYYATASVLVLANLNKETRLNKRNILNWIDGLGKILSELVSILVGIGMIIGALSLTGTAHGFSSALTSIGGQNIFLLLVMGAITSFILGIGLTISACYIFLAMLLAPTLVKLGIYPMAAHLFLLYWGCVSYITPPVALGAYAAAGIAGANPLQTGIQAVKLGFVSLLVPFFFVYNPALVGHGTVLEVVECMLTAMAGIVLLSASFEGYVFFLKRISGVVRALFAAAGLLSFHPGVLTDLIGLGLFGLGVLVHLLSKGLWARKAVPRPEGR